MAALGAEQSQPHGHASAATFHSAWSDLKSKLELADWALRVALWNFNRPHLVASEGPGRCLT